MLVSTLVPLLLLLQLLLVFDVALVFLLLLLQLLLVFEPAVALVLLHVLVV